MKHHLSTRMKHAFGVAALQIHIPCSSSVPPPVLTPWQPQGQPRTSHLLHEEGLGQTPQTPGQGWLGYSPEPLHLPSSLPGGERGAGSHGWIRAQPKRGVLQPQQRRVTRDTHQQPVPWGHREAQRAAPCQHQLCMACSHPQEREVAMSSRGRAAGASTHMHTHAHTRTHAHAATPHRSPPAPGQPVPRVVWVGEQRRPPQAVIVGPTQTRGLATCWTSSGKTWPSSRAGRGSCRSAPGTPPGLHLPPPAFVSAVSS